jgi:hypothetical protein
MLSAQCLDVCNPTNIIPREERLFIKILVQRISLIAFALYPATGVATGVMSWFDTTTHDLRFPTTLI